MNTRRPIDNLANPTVLSVSFNEDRSCFSVALETGFRSEFTCAALDRLFGLTFLVYSTARCEMIAARGTFDFDRICRRRSAEVCNA